MKAEDLSIYDFTSMEGRREEGCRAKEESFTQPEESFPSQEPRGTKSHKYHRFNQLKITTFV